MKPLLQVHPPNPSLGGRAFIGSHHVIHIFEWGDNSVNVTTDDGETWMTTTEWLNDCLAG